MKMIRWMFFTFSAGAGVSSETKEGFVNQIYKKSCSLSCIQPSATNNFKQQKSVSVICVVAKLSVLSFPLYVNTVSPTNQFQGNLYIKYSCIIGNTIVMLLHIILSHPGIPHRFGS